MTLGVKRVSSLTYVQVSLSRCRALDLLSRIICVMPGGHHFAPEYNDEIHLLPFIGMHSENIHFHYFPPIDAEKRELENRIRMVSSFLRGF